MRLKEFDYELPPDLIAQTPLPRGESRLMALNRQTGQVALRHFTDLTDYLRPGDTLVINDSRVTARRHQVMRQSGEPAEALLLRPVSDRIWHALVRPGRRLRAGTALSFNIGGAQVQASITGETPDGGRIIEFADADSAHAAGTSGEAPLPPYISQRLDDESRYQTIYAAEGGSAAAPTAGLHLTAEILQHIRDIGVAIAPVTLHVGVDTFRPVRTEDLDDHVMHGEWYTVTVDAASAINATTGRVIAIGTTSVRVLESAAVKEREVCASTAETRLFIRPGYKFRVVGGLVTNFHLPKSTLLMLVSAFAGHEYTMAAYREAVANKFRFFSFGDAMLIV